MHNDEFEALLELRSELRELHESYCSDVNGPLGTGERSPEATGRDRVCRELQDVESRIERALEEERNTELQKDG